MGEVSIILLLVLANALFAGAEIAILSVRKSRLRELVEHGVSAVGAVLRLREEPEQFLATARRVDADRQREPRLAALSRHDQVHDVIDLDPERQRGRR